MFLLVKPTNPKYQSDWNNDDILTIIGQNVIDPFGTHSVDAGASVGPMPEQVQHANSRGFIYGHEN